MLEDLARDVDRLLDACLECVTRESVSRQKCCIFQQVDWGCWISYWVCYPAFVLLRAWLQGAVRTWTGSWVVVERAHHPNGWLGKVLSACLWAVIVHLQVSDILVIPGRGGWDAGDRSDNRRKEEAGLETGLGGEGEGGSPRVRKWGEASSDPYVIQRKYIRFMVHQVYIARPSTCLLFISWQNLRIIRLWMT